MFKLKEGYLVTCAFAAVLLWWTSMFVGEPAASDTVSRAIPGFRATVPVPGNVVMPDLRRHIDYRTSQLVHVDGTMLPSRKVTYVAVPTAHSTAPRVVVVVGFDADDVTDSLLELGRERLQYAKRHDYGLFARYLQDFAAEGQPAWVSLKLAHFRLLRNALDTFPKSEWFWFLSQKGKIVDLSFPISEVLTYAEVISLRGHPVVPNDPIIMTTSNPTWSNISIIATQNGNGLQSASLLVRNTETSRALLELTQDPVFTRYEGFLSLEDSGGALLTYLTEWHTRFLEAMLIIPRDRLGTSKPCDGFACVGGLED